MLDEHSNAPPPLPGGEDSGVEDVWRLPTSVADDPDVTDGVLTLEARLLGVGSSRQEQHDPHPGDVVAHDARCGRCRWFETRIFRVAHNEYVLHHAGRTVVPGERQLVRHERAYSPYEVIEAYTIRREAEGHSFVTRPARRALAQAVAFDTALRQAYKNRVVA